MKAGRVPGDVTAADLRPAEKDASSSLRWGGGGGAAGAPVRATGREQMVFSYGPLRLPPLSKVPGGPLSLSGQLVCCGF